MENQEAVVVTVTKLYEVECRTCCAILDSCRYKKDAIRVKKEHLERHRSEALKAKEV